MFFFIVDVTSQHKVIQDVHVHEETEILEGSGDAADGNGIGGEPEEALPLVANVALIGTIYPGEAVKQGGLSGTVRADDREDLVVADGRDRCRSRP